jgi:hypothetical protein
MPAGPETFWFGAMEKDKEYVEADIDTLPAVLDYLREHDSKAEQIGRAGQQFAMKYLSGPSVLCYFADVITRIARLEEVDGTVPLSPAEGSLPAEEYLREFWVNRQELQNKQYEESQRKRKMSLKKS